MTTVSNSETANGKNADKVVRRKLENKIFVLPHLNWGSFFSLFVRLHFIFVALITNNHFMLKQTRNKPSQFIHMGCYNGTEFFLPYQK